MFGHVRKHRIFDPGVTHINRQWVPHVPILSHILTFNVASIVIGGFILSFACITIFALLFWSMDQACYHATDVTMGRGNKIERSFEKMFALSAQTFTTVGYGDIYVRCWHTNAVVTLEWYASLVLGATITGILIVNLLSPSPMVRWSKHLLLTNWRKDNSPGGLIDEEGGHAAQYAPMKALCLRTVSEAKYPITSYKLEAVAYILRVDEDKETVVGTFIEPLPLLHSENVIFHQFGAVHVIDESSPLHPLETEGRWELLQRVVCTATYHDPRFKADCVSYHIYWNRDLVRDAIFKRMVTLGQHADMHECWSNRTYDHAMIDEFEEQGNDVSAQKMPNHPLPDGHS